MSKKRKNEASTSASSSKKKRTEEYAANFEQLSLFEKLPEEILENIFQFVPCSDILSMTLVSKRFDTFIGNNKSIMCRFKVTLDIRRLRFLDPKVTIGQRNYETVVVPKILKTDLSYASRLLAKFGPTVKEISLTHKYSNDMLALLFDTCNKVEIIKCSDNILSTDNQQGYNKTVSNPPKPLILDNLKILETSLTGRTLSLFTNCQLQKICIKFQSRWFNDNNAYKKFFESQRNLEELEFPERKTHILSFLFQESFISNVNFRLKKINMKFLELDKLRDTFYSQTKEEKEIQNFQAFIKLHENSLQELYGATNETIKFFADFKSLTTVEITYDSKISASHILPSVQKLILVPRKGIASYFNGASTTFPNIKDLTISKFFNACKEFITGYGSLDKFTLKSMTVGKHQGLITLIHVKHLILEQVTFAGKLYIDEGQLEKLELKSCVNPIWLIELLKRPSTRLQLLKIDGMILTDAYRKAFDLNRNKITKLIMNNVTFD